MAICETCGNDYDRPLEIVVNGRPHMFDCFECAIQALAPRCQACGCPIIGHGVEAAERTFCCASCAHRAGFNGLRDHADVLTV